MKHLDHPLFSRSEEEFWVAPDEIEDDQLRSFVALHEAQFLGLAMEALGHFLKPEICGADLLEHDFSVRLWHDGKCGLSIYITLRFDSSSYADSDSWWIILGCPHPFEDRMPTKLTQVPQFAPLRK